MDVAWVNLIEVLLQWIRECSHTQFCWFCRYCFSYRQKRLPLFHVTVSDGTWLLSMSSCVHVKSLLDCTESFSFVVFGELHRELPLLIIFCGGRRLCPISLKLSLKLLCLLRLYYILYNQRLWPNILLGFFSLLMGTFWPVLSAWRRSRCRGHNPSLLKLNRMN